ncbi:MAG: HNH endonuclease family protein [Nocardioides sp.]
MTAGFRVATRRRPDRGGSALGVGRGGIVSQRLVIIALAAVAMAVLAAVDFFVAGGGLELEAPDAQPPAEGTYHPAGGRDLDDLLDQVKVVAARPTVPGYGRDCGTGQECSFGPAWSDDVDVAGGHNGCDTRNDVLARDMVAAELRPDTHDCVVTAGTLTDPYTGQQIAFTKEKAYEVGIDHLFPLARAWDLGASAWTPEQRRNFANDPANLLAVSGSANSSKQDRGPGEWLPVNAAYRCVYAAGYLEVAIAYHLPITAADRDAAATLAPHCTPDARGRGRSLRGARSRSIVRAASGISW